MNYNILASGSKGNAILLNDNILLECGVPFKKIQSFYKDLRLVLLTHIHSDHFNEATIKKLLFERPSIVFGCGDWLVSALLKCGAKPHNIHVYETRRVYKYSDFELISLPLWHNVENCGYKIHFDNFKMIYATDTNDLNGISAKNYDLYMIEANFCEKGIKDRIKKKELVGEFAYEKQVIKNHLSIQKAEKFIIENAGANSQYIYIHQHEED